jgi:cytochrome o ubiquinol oxidase operon protein cyoD
MTEHQHHGLHLDTAHGTVRSYIIGFILSIVLTVIPFMVVAEQWLTGGLLYCTIVVLALLQLFVQLVFFLHLNLREDGRWNLLAFVFTAIVVAILVTGTLWIMYNLNYYMVH